MISRLLPKPAGFPLIVKELRCWQEDGLISFRLSDSIDEVLAGVLRSVRERIHD